MNGSVSVDSTSSSLLARAQKHDAQAWERLCEVYAPLVYRWARQAGLQSEDAADLGQEVFRVLTTRIGTFRRSKPSDSFRGWLYGITRNKLREHFRRQTIGGEGEGGSEALTRLQEVASSISDASCWAREVNERSPLLRKTLEELRGEFEESTWQAFWRSAIAEQAATDIAADLNMSTAAVRQAKYRVLRRLRQEIAGLL